jgi:hypothetical protein
MPGSSVTCSRTTVDPLKFLWGLDTLFVSTLSDRSSPVRKGSVDSVHIYTIYTSVTMERISGRQ